MVKSSPLRGINDRDWIRGKVTDNAGNIIENVVLVRSSEPISKPSSSKARAVPTTPKLQAYRDCTLYSTPNGRITTPLKHYDFERRRNSSFPLDTTSPKRIRHSSQSESMTEHCSSSSQSSERSKPSELRQVTLESLKAWHMPGSSFATTNSVTSLPNSSSQKLLLARARKSPNGKAKDDPSLEKVEQNSSPCETNPVQLGIQSFLGKHVNQRSGTLGLIARVETSAASFRPKEEESASNRAGDEDPESSDLPEVIARLPNALYIVRMENVLGVMSPGNLIEMEPSIRGNVGIGNLVDMKLLNFETMRRVAMEFEQLSCDDYSEEQVSKVFYCLSDLTNL